MTEIKSFWIENRPTLEDIEQAFEIAKSGTTVSIRWWIRYNGSHERLISKATTEKYTYEEYFREFIPRTYPV